DHAMSEKKRKREGHDNDDRPEKRAATEHMQLNGVKVSLIPEANEWALFIAKTPGVSFPSNCPLKPYIKTGKNNASKNNASSIGQTLSSNSEHLLHTSAHPKIDYIGREEDGVGLDSWLNHYIGVYDPDTGQLQLVRARKLVLRSSVRHAQNPVEEAVKGTNVRRCPTLGLPPLKAPTLNQPKGLSGRNTLGLTFGTKKSQRAIQALAKNAISPSKQRLAQGSPTTPTLDPTASAILSSVAATTSSMPTREELQTQVDESKPRPRPTLNAGKPAEVYPIEELVGQGTLPQMMVKDWQDAIEAGEEILTKSRFVSHRVGAIVKNGD
ncbi:MAG: hypothetical protein LQ338_008343, partial [Usnochroma carphineum]